MNNNYRLFLTKIIVVIVSCESAKHSVIVEVEATDGVRQYAQDVSRLCAYSFLRLSPKNAAIIGTNEFDLSPFPLRSTRNDAEVLGVECIDRENCVSTSVFSPYGLINLEKIESDRMSYEEVQTITFSIKQNSSCIDSGVGYGEGRKVASVGGVPRCVFGIQRIADADDWIAYGDKFGDYGIPIIDTDEDQVVGFRQVEGYLTVDPETDPELRRRLVGSHRKGLTMNMSVSSATDSVIYKYLDWEHDEARVAIHDDAGDRDLLSCPVDRTWTHRPMSISLPSERGGRLATLLHSTKANPKGVAVLYHGGPRATAFYWQNTMFANALLEMGYDVVIPDYPGSYSRRISDSIALREGGKKHIEEDLRAVKRYLDTTYADQEKIFVGTSAGAMMFTISSQNENLSFFDEYILIVPWVRPVHSTGLSIWSDGPSASTISDKARNHFIDMFGVDVFRERSFFSEAAEDMERRCYAENVTAIFASRDKSSSPDHLGLCRDTAKIVVVDGDHGWIGEEAVEVLLDTLSTDERIVE